MIGTPVGRDKIRVLYLEYAIAWGGSGKSLIELIDAQENVEATILTRIPFPDSVLDGTKVATKWLVFLVGYLVFRPIYVK